MPTVIKTIITTVLLSTLLAMAGTVEARLKYYRYNDNIPMVEMSLNMMVAMGVLEPIPSRLVHDGNPYHRMVNASYGPYSRSGYSTYPERSRRYSNYRYNDYLDGPIDPYDSYYGGYNDRNYDRYYGSRYGYSPDYQRYRTSGNQWNSPWADRWGNQWEGPWGNTRGNTWDYQQGSPWSRVLAGATPGVTSGAIRGIQAGAINGVTSGTIRGIQAGAINGVTSGTIRGIQAGAINGVTSGTIRG